MKLQYDDQVQLLEGAGSGEILELLVQLAQQETAYDLQFFNYYKEVPVAAAAEILYVFGETLTCRTTPAQGRAIAQDKQTIIRGAALPHDIIATARYNADREEVALTNFAYVEVLPDRRNAVRVKVPGLCQVDIEAGTDKFQGRLRSISLSGCAVELADRSRLGTFRYFFFTIPLELKDSSRLPSLRLQVCLLRYEQGDLSTSRGIFLFEHDLRSEYQIGRYIALRQAEIIRELRN